jgi:hypothetical protein
MTKKEKIDYWKRYSKLNNRIERFAYSSILKVFKKQGIEFTNVANELSFEYALTRLNDIVNKEDFQKFFNEFYVKAGLLLLPFYQSELKKQLTKNVQPINIAFRNQEKINELGKISQRDDVGHKITSITDYTRTLIRNAMTQSINDNLTKREMASEIFNITQGQISKKRGLLIARTETTFISSTTAEINIANSGFKMNKTWIATNDLRTRDAHLKMLDYPTIGQNELFKVGDKEMKYPGDWNGGPENCCNCRCAIAYIPAPLEEQNIPQTRNNQLSNLVLAELVSQLF